MTVPDSGSAFLLNVGKKTFLVTAAHVFHKFLRASEEHVDAVCLVGDVPIPLRERQIATDSVYDVATFDLSSSEIVALARYGKAALSGSNTVWPPDPPEVGRGVFFLGFPGGGRSVRQGAAYNELVGTWLGYTAIATATGVSETDINLLFEHDANLDVGLRPRAPSNMALMGCSGAPLIAVVEHRGISSWRLGGIIYEATISEDLGIVKASRADCLNSDGTLNRYPNPMAYLR